jgi:hypothetical protein
MKFKKREIFIIEGSFDPRRFVGEDEAYLLSKDKGRLLKRVYTSNKHLLVQNEQISEVEAFIETKEVEPPISKIHDEMEFSTLNELIRYNKVELQNAYLLGDDQLEEVVDKLRLCCLGDDVIRLGYKQIRSLLCHYQSITIGKRDIKEEMGIYPRWTYEWIIKYFKGTCEEIGAYLFLECLSANNFNGFINKWMGMVVDQIDLSALKEYMKGVYIPEKERRTVCEIIDRIEVGANEGVVL